MTGYELTHTYIVLGQNIDQLWNIFLTVHIALFASVYALWRRLDFRHFVMIGVGYCAFTYLNLSGLLSYYSILDRLIVDAKKAAPHIDSDTLKVIASLDYANRPIVITIIHTSMFLIVAMLLISYILASYRRTLGKAST